MTQHATAPPTAADIQQELRGLFPFQEFTDAELSELVPLCEIREVGAGATLLAQGEASDNRVYFLLSGGVSVYVDDKFILHLRRAGDIFGEMSLINQEPRSATVRADGPTRLLVLSSLLTFNPGERYYYKFRYFFSRMFSAILADKLRLTSDRARLYEDAILRTREVEAENEDLGERIRRNLWQMRLFSHLVETAHDAIVVADMKGRVSQANASLARSFGIDPVRVKGRAIGPLLGLPRRGRRSWADIARQAAAGGWTGEVHVNGGAGQGPIVADCSVSPVEDLEHRQLAYSVILRDVRQRKLYEERILAQSRELEAANAELRELDRLKNEFLSLVSHELRTPISSILAYSETLNTEGMVDPEDREEFIAVIYKEAGRLSEMVNKVLAITKMESGQMPFDFQPGSLRNHVEISVAMVRSRAEARGLSLTLSFEGEERETEFDPERLRDVFHQVLDNAIRLTERGSIEVHLRQDRDGSTLTVRDSGPGLPPERAALVFEKFQRTATRAHHGHGLGLGLPLSYQIVKMHGGEMTFDSTPGEGSLVTVYLPHHALAQTGEAPATGAERRT